MTQINEGEEVTGVTQLAKVKSVDEFLPTPINNNQINTLPGNTYIGEEHYQVLEECLRLDSTVEEACMTAGISVSSYYKHRDRDPDFALRMERARQFPKMIARAAVQRRIRQGDAKTALRYLELRDKRYKTDQVAEEQNPENAPVVQFISVASDKGADPTKNDSQTSTNPSSVSEGYSSSGEAERMTPRENEDTALQNIAS